MLRPACFVLAVSVLLTVLFWGPLWCGYGFVGGDLYPYFFPQKVFLADRLHAGEFPLWNNLTGFGYPVLGESQTGAAYPPHVLAYYLLDANTAYNVEHLVHYILCFVGTWLFATRIGLRFSGALLTAAVFTYGWFPPRSCLEWAIVTGAWLPVCLWCVESFIQTRRWRFAIGLSVALGLQLLAGHFHLAFITQLLVVAYGAWRIWAARRDKQSVTKTGSETPGHKKDKPSLVSCFMAPVSVALLLAIGAGFLLAAVQLVPAWELKTRSSRAVVGDDHDPSYGHLPPLYASQMVAPWLWYSPLAIDGDDTIRTVAELGAPWHWFGPHRELDELLMQSRAGGLTTATNKVEAHLYCGLVPVALAVWWLFAGRRRAATTIATATATRIRSGGHKPLASSSKQPGHSTTEEPGGLRPPLRGETWFWAVCGVVALVYATGWLLPVARYVPGFNFFRGPGRYGIVTTFAVAVLAGRGLELLLDNRQAAGRFVLIGGVFWSTICDLWLVSRMVTYAVMVSHPAISYREESPIRKLLLDERSAPRLYAPGQNVCNLLGVSCLPVYLGIAPGEYSDSKFAGQGMPKPMKENQPIVADDGFSSWLRDSGVTHILAFDRLDESSWRADLVWQGMDPMLNRAWGRSEPLYLYKLRGAPGRATLLTDEDPASSDMSTVPIQREANSLVAESQTSRRMTVLVRELAYPGWQVTVDDQPAAGSSRGVFRIVDVSEGLHRITWRYQPWSVKIGVAVSLLTLFVLAAIAHVRFWHQEWLDRVLSSWITRCCHSR